MPIRLRQPGVSLTRRGRSTAQPRSGVTPDAAQPAPRLASQPTGEAWMGASSDEDAAGSTWPSDEELLTRLSDGDEVLFARLVRTWSPGMLRPARAYVSNWE